MPSAACRSLSNSHSVLENSQPVTQQTGIVNVEGDAKVEKSCECFNTFASALPTSLCVSPSVQRHWRSLAQQEALTGQKIAFHDRNMSDSSQDWHSCWFATYFVASRWMTAKMSAKWTDSARPIPKTRRMPAVFWQGFPGNPASLAFIHVISLSLTAFNKTVNLSSRLEKRSRQVGRPRVRWPLMFSF